MKRVRVTLLTVVAGVFILVTMVGLSLGAWFFAYAFERETPDVATATASLDDVRRRFAGQAAVFEVVGEDEARVRRPPPAAPPAPRVERIHVLTWDVDDGALTSVTVPFWLLRMKAGPIDLSSHVTIKGHGVGMTVEQLERYGPALLIDHETERGHRLLIWTE